MACGGPAPGVRGSAGTRGAAAVRRACGAVVLAILLAPILTAQTALDGVLFKFGGEIVTQLDVRQARLLKVLDVPNDTEQAYVEALVNRRLVLADLKRSPPAEPSPEAVDGKRRQWEARLGSGASVPDLLARAGMSDVGLIAWLRDDLRIQAYVDERFGGRAADFDGWIKTLRQRAGIR